MSEKSVLADELAYFAERKPDLLDTNRGQFALIHGRALLGTYTTFAEAYVAGVERLGNVPMLIRQIVDEEPKAQLPAFQHGLIRAHA